MFRQDWFPTCTWNENLVNNNEINNDLLERLKSFCQNLKNSDNGRIISNVGGWQSNNFYFKELSNYNLSDFFYILEKKINFCYDQLTSDSSSEKNLSLLNFWVNINSKGNFNHPHTHPQSILSGVFYLSGGSNLIIKRSDDLMGFFLENYAVSDNKTFLSAKEIIFNPERGTLLIFPSWIRHEVLPNNNDAERISIAFNTKMNYSKRKQNNESNE